MGEIKSTMDIIMERTRNLTMTEEEKRALKEQEMAGKVKGLVQRYMDGMLGLEKLMVEAASSERKDRDMLHRLLRQEAVERMEPAKDNERLLKMLQELAEVNPEPMRQILADYEKRMARERKSHEDAVRERLKKRGIFGSAVVPNLEADREWQGVILEMKRKVTEALKTGLR